MYIFPLSSRLALLILAFLTVLPVIGADPPTGADQIRKGQPADWKSVIKRNADERKALAAALMEVALDKKFKNDNRNEAIVLLAEIPSKEVFDFLLQHLSLEIPKQYMFGDGDWARLQPCRYALSNMGEAALPHLWTFLNQKRSDEELNDLAYIFRECVGRTAAIAILTALKPREASPWSGNIEKVIARLMASKG